MYKRIKIASLGNAISRDAVINALIKAGVIESRDSKFVEFLPEEEGIAIINAKEVRQGSLVRTVAPLLADMGVLFQILQEEEKPAFSRNIVSVSGIKLNSEPRRNIDKIKSDLDILRHEVTTDRTSRKVKRPVDEGEVKEIAHTMLLSLLCECGHDDAVANYLTVIG